MPPPPPPPTCLQRGDHGFGLGEHGRWAKNSMGEVATRTPLVFVVPGMSAPAARSFDVPVELLSVFPTLAELAAGASIPRCPTGDSSMITLCVDGVSLADHFAAEQEESTPASIGNPTGGQSSYSQFNMVCPGLPHGGLAVGANVPPHGEPAPTADVPCHTSYRVATAVGGTQWVYSERVVTFQGSSSPPRARPQWGTAHNQTLHNVTDDPLQGPSIYGAMLATDPTLVATLQQRLRDRIDVREATAPWQHCPREGLDQFELSAIGKQTASSAPDLLHPLFEHSEPDGSVTTNGCASRCVADDRCAQFVVNAAADTCSGFSGQQRLVDAGGEDQSNWEVYTRTAQGCLPTDMLSGATLRPRSVCPESGLGGASARFDVAAGMVPNVTEHPAFAPPGLGVYTVSSDAQCAEICLATRACRSFTFELDPAWPGYTDTSTCTLFTAKLASYSFRKTHSAAIVPETTTIASFQQLIKCKPACVGSFADRRVAHMNTRPRFASNFIFNVQAGGRDNCSDACEGTFGCVSFTFVATGAQRGKCQGYSRQYRNPGFRVPHATKDFYYVDGCTPACDTSSSRETDPAIQAIHRHRVGGMVPIFTSGWSTELLFNSKTQFDEPAVATDIESCANACRYRGELLCKSFTFKSAVGSSYGLCRLYPNRYGPLYLKPKADWDYYPLLSERCSEVGIAQRSG